MSAKRVASGGMIEACFGGMIRGMIRPRLFTVYTNIPLLRRRSSSHSLFLKGPTGPWHSKARFRYDSGYVSGMIPGVIRACNCFWKNRKHIAVSNTFKTMHILCTKSQIHSGDIV